MAQTLAIPNFSSLNIVERSTFNADEAVGQTSLTVAYSDNMAATNYVYLGNLASESGEVKAISSITDANTIVITAATVKPHARFEPVTVLFGNKIKVYRAANVDGSQPLDVNFSAIDTIDIDFDQASTNYSDSTGSDSYWYKFTYYNSTSLAETALGSSLASRGTGTSYTNYASIESIREEAGLKNNRYITEALVDEKRQFAQQKINADLQGIYTLPFTAPINPIISEITRKYAAGLLLIKDYGVVSTFSTNNGQALLDYVTNADKTGVLDRLVSKELVLTDQTGGDTSIPGTGNGFGGWPNADTAEADPEDGGAERKFRMADEY